jgi:excisionase family DNA binding protein
MWQHWLMTSGVAQQPIFTVSEIATGLRMSDETIRRKIQNGELHALQIGAGPRKTIRVLARDLVQWLGPTTAREVFGIGEGLAEVRRAFEKVEPEEREAIINEAIKAARAQQPERKRTGRTVSPEEIAARFKR